MEPNTRIAILAAIALGAGLVVAPAAAADCPGSTVTAATQSEAAIEQSLLCLINERRASAGLNSLAPSSALREAGARHSTDMVNSGFFAHTSPSGVGFIDRILATGYTRRARGWVVGENLVWGSNELSSPEALVEAWMQSPPHRENLLRPRFRELGVAAVRGTPYDARDADGVTVSSEYGFRGKSRKKKGKGKRGRSYRR